MDAAALPLNWGAAVLGLLRPAGSAPGPADVLLALTVTSCLSATRRGGCGDRRREVGLVSQFAEGQVAADQAQ